MMKDISCMQDGKYVLFKITSSSSKFPLKICRKLMFYRCCHLASSDKQLLVPLGHNSQVINIIPKYAN